MRKWESQHQSSIGESKIMFYKYFADNSFCILLPLLWLAISQYMVLVIRQASRRAQLSWPAVESTGQQESTVDFPNLLEKFIQSTLCMRWWTTYTWHIFGIQMSKKQINECHFDEGLEELVWYFTETLT